MISRYALLFCCALMTGGATSATAADLFGGMKDGGYEAPASIGPSWYVRIDGGYAGYDDPVMTEAGIYDLVDESIDNSWTLGGGLGRYFTPAIRGDVTYDHRFEADAQANLLDHLSGADGTRSFGLVSDVVLFNLYYDFNRGARFSPYVGVGLGVTYNQTTQGVLSNACGCIGTIEEGDETHVAGALMAGFTAKIRGGTTVVGGSAKDTPVTVDSGRNLYLDVGYRFLYLGEVATGPIVTDAYGQIADDPTVENIHAHELRVGLRYDIR